MSRGTVSNGPRLVQPGFHPFERERALGPVPGITRIPPDGRDTIARMPGAPASTRIEIPRWVQLVGLPLLLLLVWVVAGAVRHVVFLFLVALLIALLLNPLVRGLGRVWIPRGLAVAIVYLAFAAALALAVLALATVVVQQTRSASHRVDNYFTVVSGRTHQTGADHDLARFQHWLERASPQADPRREERTQVPQLDRDEGRREVHDEGAELGRGRGARGRLAALQRAAHRRRVDLHAARHAAAESRGRPPVPAGAGEHAADRADGAGARELREGPAAALAHHRRELRPRPVDPRHVRARSRTAASTRCSSARGRASPS